MLKQLTVLCENSVGKVVHAIGEHGFACLVETDHGPFLFDTGQGLGILHNCRALGLSLDRIRGIILSHGHFDHVGGLEQVLDQTGSCPVYGHPDLFKERYWVGKYEQRANGVPVSQACLEEQGAAFNLSPEFRELVPGLWLSGEIPRHSTLEHPDPALCFRGHNGDLIPDRIEDDCSLVLESSKGLVVLLGCAHAGLANILNYIAAKMNVDHIYAVVGGMHLAPATAEQFDLAVSVLQRYKVQKIGVGHCTGQRRSAELYARFPSETFFLSVGETLSP